MAEARAAARRSPTSLKYASRAGGGLAAGLDDYWFSARRRPEARRRHGK